MNEINSRLLTREELYSWDLVANHFYGIESITEEQKEALRNAFLFLKVELGEKYLKEIDRNHPMSFHLINAVLTSKLWFVDLATNIKGLKTCNNYKALHRRLMEPRKFPEAFSVLEIAIKFLKNGYIIEFDPKVEINGRGKEPDLKVINKFTDESFYCEISELKASDIERSASNTCLKLFNAVIYRPELLFAGKIERILSELEIEEIYNQIIKLSGEIEKTGMGELMIDKTMKLALALKENELKLKGWAKANGCEVGNFEQPYFDRNELNRMKTKINEKRKQLPYDTPGIIMIYDNDFFYVCGDFLNAINVLEKHLAKYNNITAVIIRGKFMATMEEFDVKIKEHRFIQKKQYDNYVEQYLILWNEKADFKFSNNERVKLEECF